MNKSIKHIVPTHHILQKRIARMVKETLGESGSAIIIVSSIGETEGITTNSVVIGDDYPAFVFQYVFDLQLDNVKKLVYTVGSMQYNSFIKSILGVTP